MNERWKDVAVRAVRTFWQAALGYLLADAPALQRMLAERGAAAGALRLMLIGALAAGLSALYNGVLRPLLEAEDGE